MKISKHDEEQIIALYSRWKMDAGCNSDAFFVQEQAKMFYVSEREIYRIISEHCDSARKRKNGDRLFTDTETQKDLLAIISQYDFAMPHARDVWLANTGEELPSASAMNHWLRRDHLSREKIQKMVMKTGQVQSLDFIRLEAEFSNQTWQLDFSMSKQYYIDVSGTQREYNPLTHSKNKKARDKAPLWLYSVVDDHSRAVFSFFYPGLSSQYAVDFLIRAMSPKGRELLADQVGAPAWVANEFIAAPDDASGPDWLTPERFPFSGLMDIILTDNDSILKSSLTLFKTAVEQLLQKKIIHHLAGRSNVKGKVENSFWILTEFQKVTKAGVFTSMYEANLALMDFLLDLNTRRNAFSKWISGLNGAVQTVDPAMLRQRLFLRRISKKVDTMVSIFYDGNQIYLPREQRFRELVGEVHEFIVPVNYKHGDNMAAILDGVETWLTPLDGPPTANTGKQWVAQPKTDQQRMIEEALGRDMSHLVLTGIYNKIPRNQQEYELPVTESYNPETLQPVKGQPRSLLYAARRFVEENLFHETVTAEETRWLKITLFKGKGDALVYDAEIEDLIRKVKHGDRNVDDKVVEFHGAEQSS